MATLRVNARLALLAAALATVHGQALPACGQGCYAGVRAKFGSLGCPSDTESCLCSKPDFQFGIRDCAIQACGPDVASQVVTFASGICATATLPTIALSTPGTSSISSTSSPSLSTSSSTTAVGGVLPETSTALPASSSAVLSSTSITPSTLRTSVQPSTTAAATSSGGNATAAGQSSRPTDGAQPTANNVDAASPKSELPTAAKAGIGIGVGITALTLVAVAFWIFKRPRKQRRGRSLQISDPMPGSGRNYADDLDRYPSEKPLTELEMRSRRYEEMVPRQKPRRTL